MQHGAPQGTLLPLFLFTLYILHFKYNTKSNKVNWSHNTHTLEKKGQSWPYRLDKLRSFGACRTLQRTFYSTVMTIS